ncbi:MAG: helicase-exonuclease AddAB subunit AddA [Bacillota bacterium]|nr:helicase-exonuclease AddAB subunit AddA [Bacillota bacterium]
MPQWTEAQKQTIDVRNKNILVSAAAGSGKTAVLVERIKTLVIDEQANIDSFLITTFTKAASEEMKQRLETAIREELASGVSGEARVYLLRQLQILPSAAIGTFHSFALDLIRQYFYLTDLEPGFGILDEVQQVIMKRDAIDRVFENRYESEDEKFLDFLRKHSSDRSDNALKENIIKMYNSLRSIPHYMQWAEEKTRLMNGEKPSEAMGLTELIRTETMYALTKALEYFDKAARILDTVHTHEICGKAREDVQRIELAIRNADDFDKTKEFFDGKFNSMRAKKAEKTAYEEVKERVSALRDEGKKLLDSVAGKYYQRSMEDYDADIRAVYPDTQFMVGLIREFEAVYQQAKAEENVIDMDDVMHRAIEVLEDEKAASEQRARFRYIFVDEYQDSNMLQETIVRRIARADNLFMVGDVKQSIYKFRLAEPELFISKAKAYSDEKDQNSIVIDLNSNFRSKKSVTETVNAVFREVMAGYDDKAELHCMMPDEYPGHNTTMHIIDRHDFGDDAPERGEAEAEVVASIIRDALGSEIYDFKKDTTRTVDYRDIVVLARAGSTVAEIERYLNNEGIPAYGDTGEGYFETVEIQVFLNLMRVIDNMRQDVPLISVMRSVIFGFGVKEMAKIRINQRAGSFCSAVRAYMKSGPDRELREKLQTMDERISRWKEIARTVPLEELVRMLLYDTGYYDYCSGLPVGRQRISNLQLIVEKAVRFEQSSHEGLNGFLRYVEAMANSNTSEAEAKTISENENVVRVMTVHKSKGLEFPVVIFTGAGKKVSGGGKNNAPLHKDFGIGLPLINRTEHWKKKTLLQNAISARQSEENLDEAIRILYVALTRAKDRLDIVGSVENTDKLSDVAGTGSYIDMMYAPLLQQPETDIRIYDKLVEAEETESAHRGKARELLKLLDEDVTAGEEVDAEIDRRLSFVYPHVSEKPAKLKYSVTELNRALRGEDHTEVPIPIASFEPDQTRHRLSAAEVGTVMHLVMEHIDFMKAAELGEAHVNETADRLLADGAITEEERNVIHSDKIAGFFDDAVGRRAAEAFARGELYREKEFILDQQINGEAAVVQGIIDCYFREGEDLVLIDYKNSYMGAGRTVEDVRDTYRGQIDIYRQALQGATGRNVRESYLFLFDLGKFITM